MKKIKKIAKTIRTPEKFKKLGHNPRHENPGSNRFFVTNSSVNQEMLTTLGMGDFDINNYIPSKFDRPDWVKVKDVALIHSKGLYAEVDILEGDCIGEYTGEILSNKEFEEAENDPSYAMKVGKHIVDAREKGNFTRYMNCSDVQANAQFIEYAYGNRKIAKVIATSNIPKGSQILIDYNTHAPEANKDHIFLNPEDNEQSFIDQYNRHRESYIALTLPQELPGLNLKANDWLLITPIMGFIYTGEDTLEDFQEDQSIRDVNLPIFKFAEDNNGAMVINDSFTLLMLTAYLGQIENVKWLVEHKASIDRQNHFSGNNALFCALAGYIEQTDAVTQDNYVEIIRYLIEKGANLGCHDKNDNTFLHLLLRHPNTYFKAVMDELKKKDQKYLKPLIEHLDDNDEDLIMICMRLGLENYLKDLLEIYPDYFDKKNFGGPRKEFQDQLKTIWNQKSTQEKQQLLEVFKKAKVQVNHLFTDASPNEEDNQTPTPT